MAFKRHAVPQGVTGDLQQPVIDYSLAQKVAVGSSSVQSTAIGSAGDGPIMVKLKADTACWIKVGEDPTAAADTAGNEPIYADDQEWFAVMGGHKIAVIRDSDDGSLYILPAKTI